MRKFQCGDCQHTWELPFGEGGQGSELTCPACGSRNIHRHPGERGGRGRERKGHGRGAGRGWGAGRGRQGADRSASTEA